MVMKLSRHVGSHIVIHVRVELSCVLHTKAGISGSAAICHQEVQWKFYGFSVGGGPLFQQR